MAKLDKSTICGMEGSGIETTVQTDRLETFNEAVKSNCDNVRFGSEFCEWKIPTLDLVKEAYVLAKDNGKDFIYITPRVSDRGIKNIQGHLEFLNTAGRIVVVVNDFGVLNVLKQHPNLRPHLGRQLIYIPARCPWEQITENEVGFITKRQVSRIFYQTSLNYIATIRFFQDYGVQGVDVDWIPECFSAYDFISRNGLDLSIHLHLVPVTITRRCHTARFLGEKNLENCRRPCYFRTFVLKHDVLEIELILCGNAVFRLKPPSREEVKQLHGIKVTELVLTMNPATGIENRQGINDFLQRLQS